MKKTWRRSGFTLGVVLILLAAIVVGGCLTATLFAEPRYSGDKLAAARVGWEFAVIEVDGVTWWVPTPGAGPFFDVDPPGPLRLQIAGGILASYYRDPTWRNVKRKSWSDHFITIGHSNKVAAQMADILGGMIALARTDGLYEAAGGS